MEEEGEKDIGWRRGREKEGHRTEEGERERRT